MSENILSQLSDSILQLSIHRPSHKNALDKKMYQRLGDEINAASSDTQVRVIVLSGSEGCFTSGNDLTDFKEATGGFTEDDPVLHFLNALANFPKPIVVAVEGVAVGIGSTLLLHSDLVYASPTARFSFPFSTLGLCPEFASTLLLPRMLGHVKAAEWLMLGEMFNANEALEQGLINAIVEDPLQMALQKASKLSKQAPLALQQTKALMKAPVKERVQQVMVEEFKLFGEGLVGAEFKEAVTAFFEKRPADFSKF